MPLYMDPAAPRSWGPGPTGMPELGGQHDLRPPVAHGTSDDLLGRAIGVGGVHEVSAGIEIAVDEPDRRVLVASPMRAAPKVIAPRPSCERYRPLRPTRRVSISRPLLT